MKLTVKCFATLMPLTPPGGSLEFHGTDVCDLLRQLSIPESEAWRSRGDFPPRGRRVISVFAQ